MDYYTPTTTNRKENMDDIHGQLLGRHRFQGIKIIHNLATLCVLQHDVKSLM